MRKFIYFLLMFSFVLISCHKKGVNYKEKISGIWQISNVPEILKNSGNDVQYNADVLRKATISFEENGKLIANISKLEQKGSWSISDDGTLLTLKADALKFEETLHMKFENERSIIINNNGKIFTFKKIKD